MPRYTQICRAAAVLLLMGTGLMAAAVIGLALLAVFGLAFLQEIYTQGEQIVPLQLIGWIAGAFVVPALLLMWFYLVVITGTPGVTSATIGWLASAVFHLGLTVLFVTVLPGKIETTHSLLSMPLWILTALATATSIYLAITCRQAVVSLPPPMPAVR